MTNRCGTDRPYLRCFRNPVAFIFGPDWHIVSFSYPPELDDMDFAVFDAESLQEFLDRIRDLRGYQPHQDVPLATAYEFIPISGQLVGIFVLCRSGLQLHENIRLKLVLEKKVESPHFSERLLTALKDQFLSGEKVGREFGD